MFEAVVSSGVADALAPGRRQGISNTRNILIPAVDG